MHALVPRGGRSAMNASFRMFPDLSAAMGEGARNCRRKPLRCSR